jgi:hypothetical protein
VSRTLTARIEDCLDRWNALPRHPHSELASAVTAASLGLGELLKQHRALARSVDDLEGRLDTAEENLVA